MTFTTISLTNFPSEGLLFMMNLTDLIQYLIRNSTELEINSFYPKSNSNSNSLKPTNNNNWSQIIPNQTKNKITIKLKINKTNRHKPKVMTVLYNKVIILILILSSDSQNTLMTLEGFLEIKSRGWIKWCKILRILFKRA